MSDTTQHAGVIQRQTRYTHPTLGAFRFRFWIRFLVLVTMLMGWGIGGCLAAPGRDQTRDAELQAQFDQRRLERSRLKPSMVDELPVSRSSGATEPLVRGDAWPEHSTYFYWVSDMATGDALTGLTRRSELMAAGAAGFQACLKWLVALRLTQMPGSDSLSTGGITRQSALPGVLQVITTLSAMRKSPETFGISTDDDALLAAAVTPWTTNSWEPLRVAAFSLLATCFGATEAATLAMGLAQQPRGIASDCADALTVHRVVLKTSGDWLKRVSETSLGLRADVQTLPGALRVVGYVSPEAEAELARLAPEGAGQAEWRKAVTWVVQRSRAALAAVPQVWALLGDPDPAVRALAAQTLRRLTLHGTSSAALRTAAAQYHPLAPPLARVESQLRWLAELLADGDLAPYWNRLEPK